MTPLSSFELELPMPRVLSSSEELDLTRQLAARVASSTDYKLRLGHMLLLADRFDELIELLEPIAASADSFEIYLWLAQAHLARETDSDTRRAKHYSHLAVGSASSTAARANAYACLGKAYMRLGELEEAAEVLDRALQENPHNKDAFKRLVALHLSRNQAALALELVDRALAGGVRHARVLAAHALALARLDRIEEARAVFGLESYLSERVLEAPEGWASIKQFNKDLAAEMQTHPNVRYGRYGVASMRSWRVDEPLMRRSPVLAAFLRELRLEVMRYLSVLPVTASPWNNARPDKCAIRSWCVMVDDDGFEAWHVHQNGWLSGAYYVEVPDSISEGASTGGCIGFGLPEEIVGKACHDAFGLSIVRPRSGRLLLFPSHSYHRTFAHGGQGRRICVAFDIADNDPLH